MRRCSNCGDAVPDYYVHQPSGRCFDCVDPATLAAGRRGVSTSAVSAVPMTPKPAVRVQPMPNPVPPLRRPTLTR
jgi:hypothetical protein